jgi:hypothetical protein
MGCRPHRKTSAPGTSASGGLIRSEHRSAAHPKRISWTNFYAGRVINIEIMAGKAELEKLYDTHANALFAFLLNFTRNESDTRDLMQDLFLKVARHPETFASARDERAYLLRLAHNAGTEAASPPHNRFASALLAFTYVCVIWFLTPLALFLTFENVRGEIAWRNERARLSAAGEKLAMREILGPEVPAAQNAGAGPIFAPVFDYSRMPDANKLAGSGLLTHWRETNATETFSQRAWLPQPTPLANGNQPHTPRVNLDAWAQSYLQAVKKPDRSAPAWVAQLRLPEGTNDPARVVLACLDHISSGLAEFDTAARLPRSQFPIDYDEAFDALLPHIAALKNATLALEVRCAARLAAGQTNPAAEDVESALRVAELLREEPLLISQLVRDAQAAIAAATLWQGLAVHAWTEPQLARWQDFLSRVDYRKSIAAALEGERICALKTIDDLIFSGDPGFLGDEIGGWSSIRALGGAFFVRGFIRQNEVALSLYSQTVIGGVRRWSQTTPPGSLLDLLSTFTAAEGERTRQTAWFSPYTAILRMLTPGLRNTVVKTARTEAVTKMAALACALERYRLAHGEYPESLAALSPAIMTAIPPDPVTSRPFHYSRTNDGWFLLYSVGENGIDDGGLYRKGKEHDILDWPWPVPSRPALENLF